MLKIAHISAIKPGKDDESYVKWKQERLAKFTSSEIHFLTYPTGLTEGSLSYIRRKVGEELTGNPAREDIDTDATRHGLQHEEAAVRKFGVKMGIEFVIVQQLIADPDTRFGGTPDALILLRVSPDGLEYEVETVEVKCPPSFDGYISLFECETPEALKKAKREYYWQVMDQMLLCGAKRGHFVIYHPDFKAGNHKSIIFNPLDPVFDKDGKKTFPIHEDLKTLRLRKAEALIKFDQIRSKLMAVPAI
jgi:YqaJ-like viral recombinase domain